MPPLIKRFGIIWITLSVFAGTCTAAEESRTWTNTEGKTVKGILRGKTATHAEILLPNGNRVQLELKKLIEADQKHVEQADVYPDPILKCRTITAEKGDGKTKPDVRNLEITLERMHGRKYIMAVLWLGDGGDKGKYGIYRAEQTNVSEDGKQTFIASFNPLRSPRTLLGNNYRGYVVALKEFKEGQVTAWTVIDASQKPFERFLSEEWEPKLKVKDSD